MMHLKALINNINIRYIIIIFFLLTITIFLYNFSIIFANHSFIQKNSEINRTITGILKEEYNIDETLKNYEQSIDKYNFADGYHIITFKTVDEADDFYFKTSNYFSEIGLGSIAQDNTELISSNIANIILVITIIILFILVTIFLTNIIHNLEKDISLYKLIGYKDNMIIKTMILSIIILFIILFTISFTVNYLLFTLLNNIDLIDKINIKWNLNIRSYFFLLSIIFSSILVSIFKTIIKIKRISPIQLIKSC